MCIHHWQFATNENLVTLGKEHIVKVPSASCKAGVHWVKMSSKSPPLIADCTCYIQEARTNKGYFVRTNSTLPSVLEPLFGLLSEAHR